MISLKVLTSHSLFGGITEKNLKQIVPFLVEEKFSKGEEIITEGECGDRLYFIYKGSVEIIKKIQSKKNKPVFERISTLSKGDTFGEMELIDVQPRVATVRALKDTVTLTLSNRALYKISRLNLEMFTIIIMNLAREISRRLRKMDALAANFLFRNSKTSKD